MPIQLSFRETLRALRETSLQRSSELSSPAKDKTRALVQQLASAAHLQLNEDTFASARALYENTMDQVKDDPRLDRDLVQKKVPLIPLNNTTPLDWSLDHGDLESAIVLGEGPAALLGKLDLSKRGHQSMLGTVLGAIEADTLGVAMGISRLDAADLLAGEGATTVPVHKLDQASGSVAKLINTVGRDGLTLFLREVAAGRANTVNVLLQSGADVAQRDDIGHRAPSLALRSGAAGTRAVLKHLVDAGASLDATDVDGTSMLTLALQHAPMDALAYVLQNLGSVRNIDIAKRCVAWLDNATKKPSADHGRLLAMAKLFMGQGLAANGFVDIAIQAQDTVFLQQVLSQLPKNDPTIRKQLEREVLRWVGKSEWTSVQLATLKIALRHGLSPRMEVVESSFLDSAVRDLMGAAALRGDLPLVKLLAESRAPIDNEDSMGITPLGHAARRRHKPIYDYLHSIGARDRSYAICRSHWDSPPERRYA